MQDGVLKKALGGVEDGIASAHNALSEGKGGKGDFEAVQFLSTMTSALLLEAELEQLRRRGLGCIDKGTAFGKALECIRSELYGINAELYPLSDADGDEVIRKLSEIRGFLITLGDSVRGVDLGADSASTRINSPNHPVASEILKCLKEEIEKFRF